MIYIVVLLILMHCKAPALMYILWTASVVIDFLTKECRQ